MRFITFIFFVLISVCAIGQDKDLWFRHITAEDGLPNNTVWSVTQDQAGFMWFGTNDGLCRYDGYEFRIFRHIRDDSLSLCDNRIIYLTVANEGTLWIGTAQGINWYNKEKNTFPILSPPTVSGKSSELYVRSIVQDQQGILWVGTSTGLFCIDPLTKTFIVNGSNPDDPYVFFDKNIYNIVEDDEMFWICTTEGLYIFKDDKIVSAENMGMHPVFYAQEPVRDILIDNNKGYWITTESMEFGILRFSYELKFIKEYRDVTDSENGLSGIRGRSIKQISDGTIWAGTYNGLKVINPASGVVSNYGPNKYDPATLSHKSIRDIFEDRNGGVWISTFAGGVNYFHPAFTTFKHVQEEVWKDNSISDNLVTSFLEEANGNIWIGTENGLNVLDSNNNDFLQIWRKEGGLLDNSIKSLAKDRSGNLWIGSMEGLSMYDPRADRFRHFIHNPDNQNSIGQGRVEAIYADSLENIWLGIWGGGVNRLSSDLTTVKRFGEIEEFPGESIDSHVHDIEYGGNNMLWIATERSGLECFDMEKEIITRKKLLNDGVYDLFSNMNILSLYLDSEKVLWLCTYGEGIYLYDTRYGDVFPINDSHGLPSNTINAVLEDTPGIFWVSTNRGLAKIKKPVAGWNEMNSSHMDIFGKSYGLQGLQYYQNSALKGSNGKMYFGGINGYNEFFPHKVNKISRQSEVVFTNIRFGEDMDTPQKAIRKKSLHEKVEEIKLEYNQSDISIEFAALNYFDPENNTYAYKLEPLDENWKYLEDRNVVNFSNLPPGNYMFKVRTTNDKNYWESEFNQISFVVLPPFWRTGIAFIIYVVILVVLLFIFFQIASRLGRLKSDLAWEHIERERIEDQNQLRIKFFTDISHELRTPLTLILAPLENLIKKEFKSPKHKIQLQMIQRNGERMLRLINQLLDLRKFETGNISLKAGVGNIVVFIQEICIAFRESAVQKQISLSFSSTEDKIMAWYDRDKLEIIIFNLLSNAIKYTPEKGKVGVYLNQVDSVNSEENKFKDGYIEITIEDDGKGIPAEQLDKIFDRFYQVGVIESQYTTGSGVGLEIVKKYVELHKGTISVSSIVSEGPRSGKTRFSIRLPRGRNHLEDSDILENILGSEDISSYQSFVDYPEEKMEISKDSGQIDNQDTGKKEKDILLVVEDNIEVRGFIASLFDSEYKVYEAPDGEKGLKLALDKIPDLIISDVMMPEMDGIELCKRLKTDEHTSHIPVILLTARTAITFQLEGIETGADDYITKPFSGELLKMRVSKFIEQRQKLKSKFSKGFNLIPEEVSITSVDEKLMEKSMKYILEHITDPELSVDRLASEIGFSRVHYYRKVKALTNLTPIQFIRLIRLKKAAQMLETGKLNIGEVRYAVGFDDADYFRNAFKEQFGMTPSAFMDSKTEGKENKKTYL